MKLISLNTWGGRAGREKLLAFFDTHRDIDIFCLQEIWAAPYKRLEGVSAGGKNINHAEIMTNGVQDISGLLTNHTAYFRPHHLDNYGLMMLVKNNLQIIAEGDLFVYKERGYLPEGDVGFHARNIQHVSLATKNGERTVINFHGLWNGGGKNDNEDRLQQSDKIIGFMKTIQNPYVICGDFNLLPHTESIKKLEAFGLRNLIKEYKITSTRSSYYTKEQKFADYALVSNDIKVKDFKVLPDEVSDHLPLYLEFA